MSLPVNPEDIKAKYASLVPFTAFHEDLAASNTAYLLGQIIWVIVGPKAGPRSSWRIGMKKGDWFWKTEPYSAATKYNDLGWIIPPSESGNGRVNVFKITNEVNVPATYEYDAETATITLTDERLKGKINYPVTTTMSGEIRNGQLTYDPIAGNVKILNTAPLEDGDHFTIFIPAGISADPDYAAINHRLERLEAFTAPLLKGGIVWPWTRPVEDIPDTWQIVPDLKGKFVVAMDAANALFDAIGKTGGREGYKLSVANIPEMDPSNGEFNRLLAFTGSGTIETIDNNSPAGKEEPSLLDSKEIKKIGTKDADLQAVPTVPPYVVITAYIEPKPDLLTLYPF